jgi:hypothetical protein
MSEPTPPSTTNNPTPDGRVDPSQEPAFNAQTGFGNPTYANNIYYVRDPQRWAVDQEHYRHNQAIWMLGEYVMYALMWHIEDFDAGLVGRCNRCAISQGKVFEAYGQSDRYDCPDCYSTTFEGGIRALIIRPAVIEDTDEGETHDRRGIPLGGTTLNVETTTDFRVRTMDYMFRADGSRWQLRVPKRVTLRTGFEHPYQATSAISYNNLRASSLDPVDVAYQVGPYAETDLATILTGHSYGPTEFTQYEIVNGPLIPEDTVID